MDSRGRPLARCPDDSKRFHHRSEFFKQSGSRSSRRALHLRRLLRVAVPLVLLATWEITSVTGFLSPRTLDSPATVVSAFGHLIATGQSGEVVRATVVDVRTRLRWLAHRRRVQEEEDRQVSQLDLAARWKNRQEQDDREREERRRKRNEKRRKGGAHGVKSEEDTWEGRLGIIA